MRTVQDIAALLAIGENQVLHLIHSGILPAVNVAVRPGKPRWRISQEHLDEFIRTRSAKPPAKMARRRRTNHTKVTQYF